ncbi:MAG: hypothetical protein ACJ754_08050 [Pyrinomonadaceae bacterium]
MTKRLVTLLLVLAFSAAPALGQGTPLAGTWKVTGDISGYPVDQLCTFTQDGKKLAGSCKSADDKGSVEINGEVDDKKVTWSFKSEYNGQPITVTFKGTLDEPTQFKGDIDVQPLGAPGTFSAKKEEAKKEETKKPQ